MPRPQVKGQGYGQKLALRPKMVLMPKMAFRLIRPRPRTDIPDSATVHRQFICSLSPSNKTSTLDQKNTRSPAVARMADRTALVVKLTLALTVTRHNLAKACTSPLNGPIMRQNKAYRAIFCTLKTTSGFIFLLPVV